MASSVFLDLTWGGSFTGQMLAPDGSVTAPSYSFTNDSTLGFYRAGTNLIGVAAGGGTGSAFGSGTFRLASGSSLSWSDNASAHLGTLDINLFREGADHLIQRRTTNAQRLSVSNTYSSASSNELFSVDWQTTANTAIVGNRTAATGTTRRLALMAQGTNASAAYAGISLLRGGNPEIRMGIYAADGTTPQSSGITEFLRAVEYTNTTTSGTVSGLNIIPTYNQAAATTANTDLLINRTETSVGSGSQLLADMQVGSSSRHAIDTTGAILVGGANGQVFNGLKSLTELTVIAAAASTDTTIQMPANSVVLGVSVRVTVVIPTAATFTVGDSGSAARFSTAAVSTAATSTDSGTKAGAYYNASALSVRLTPNVNPANNSGRVRVTIYYYTVTPPTS